MIAPDAEHRFDPAYLRSVALRLSSIGSSPLGLRAAGTPEDRRATTLLAAEMRGLGLRKLGLDPADTTTRGHPLPPPAI